jgi:hypothetical protein
MTTCTHLNQIRDVPPEAANGCVDCLASETNGCTCACA